MPPISNQRAGIGTWDRCRWRTTVLPSCTPRTPLQAPSRVNGFPALSAPVILKLRLTTAARGPTTRISSSEKVTFSILDDFINSPTLSPKTRRPCSAKTVQGYRWCWDQVLQLLPRGREAPLTDLTTGFVADFRARRRAGGASEPTINRNLTATSAFLSWVDRGRSLEIQRPCLPHERELLGARIRPA